MLEILPIQSIGQPVTIDGYLVPRVQVNKTADTDTTGQWNVSYDNRFSILASQEEMQRWLWLFAQAQAISEGWSCHGEHSRRANPHQVKVMGIGCVETVPAPATDTRQG